MKRKILKIWLVFLILCICLPMVKTQAVLQSRPGFTSMTSTAVNWFTSIRDMEKSGGPLGLSASIDSSTYLDNTSGTKNGVDIHMIKNSEWGAVLLLSLSAYGGYTGGAITDINTYSTGPNNYTGVYGLGNGWEYMATTVTNTAGTSVYGLKASKTGVDSRYYDTYIYQEGANSDETRQNFWTNNYINNHHYGDGMYEMNQIVQNKCSGATRNLVSSSGPWFLRGLSFALASSYNGGYSYSGRAVVVCAGGL